MWCPDPPHAAMAAPGGLGHCPAGPVRPLVRRFGQRRCRHPCDRLRRRRRLVGRSSRLMLQPLNSFAMNGACQRQIVRSVFASLSLDRHCAHPFRLSSTIRACQTCFCGLFLDPITASNRSRSPGPSRTVMPFLIQPDLHTREPAGIVRQRRSTLMSAIPSSRQVNSWLSFKHFQAMPDKAGGAVVETTVDHTLMRGLEPHDR